MLKTLSVLVTGATGKQGGALARLLLKRGHRVRALTRHPDSPAARELESRGAELVPGDFEDLDSLVLAARDMDAVFAMATPYSEGALDVEREVRHGRHLIQAARIARVRHFLYSSVAGADTPTGIPHFDSKHQIERHLRLSGLVHTIVGPVFFMENFTGPAFAHGLAEGLLTLPLPHHRGLQMIPVGDLATFCARVLEWPEEFLEQRVELASDEVTGEQAAALITYVSGHKLRYQQTSLADVRAHQGEDLARMYAWLDQVGYHANISGLRRDYPELGWHTFEDWARTQDWEALLVPPWRGPLSTTPSLSP
jgi:uncharacterized protein YbjT (DUF2867 family)